MGEQTSQDHLNTSDQKQTKAKGDLRDNIKDRKISSTNKVVPFEQLPHLKNKNQQMISPLVLFFQENVMK